MHVRDLPASVLVGATAEVLLLQRLLEEATKDRFVTFNHFDKADGGNCSCRILVREKIPDFTTTMPLNWPHSSIETAMEFFNPDFMAEVRFFPSEPPDKRAKKGWEVRVAQMWNQPVVIVFAKWIL